jgi:hypothetical protein
LYASGTNQKKIEETKNSIANHAGHMKSGALVGHDEKVKKIRKKNSKTVTPDNSEGKKKLKLTSE